MSDGITEFLKERCVPLTLSIMFTDYLRDEVNRQLIIRNKSQVRKTMEKLKYDDIMSYWLRFVYNLRMEIMEQEKKKKKKDKEDITNDSTIIRRS